MDITLSINGQERSLSLQLEDTPLLWVLRDELGLVGTKFGCGGGYCGACTVHMDGVAVRSCSIPAAALQGREITTIEGLASEDNLHPLQQAWIDQDVPQCGYCQAGQIMNAAALLARNVSPDDATIDAQMSGNLCRCGCYVRIRSAIKQASETMGKSSVAHWQPSEKTEVKS